MAKLSSHEEFPFVECAVRIQASSSSYVLSASDRAVVKA